MSQPFFDRDSYRERVRTSGLTRFQVRVEQTDLFIRAERDFTEEARALAVMGRSRIIAWAETHPGFLTSLAPLLPDPLAPSPVREMLAAGSAAGVGPMAAVAGALAEFVGRPLLAASPGGVIVENGGDVFLALSSPAVVGLFAGPSVLSGRLGLVLSPGQMPAGVCTSSGTVGHSLSFGRADAAVIVARSAALADAAATGLGNRVQGPADIEPALAWALGVEGVSGAVVILGERVGLRGELELTEI
jgi:hypothetical protein